MILTNYYTCSGGVLSINHFKLRNFAVVAIECFIETFDRGRIMTRIHRWSVMIYGSLQAELMETKRNGHAHMFGTLIFGTIVTYLNRIIVIKYFEGCKI